MVLAIITFTPEYEKRWDQFVLNESINGTFHQTRNFLNYHIDIKFEDHSLIFLDGSNICAVMPACIIESDGKKVLYSHRGASFGGLVLNTKSYSIRVMKEIFVLLENHIKSICVDGIVFKNTPSIYCNKSTELLDYFLYHENYSSYSELNFYIDYAGVPDSVEKIFSHNKRWYYKKSLGSGLSFREITTDDEISKFYEILKKNLRKHNHAPVHSLKELIDLYRNRMKDSMIFFGVFKDDALISGSMVFYFGKKTFHTQYIATDDEYGELYPTYFLYGKLIETGKKLGYDFLSFGISTEDDGKYLNEGLALFKEGFGSTFLINRTYYKNL